MRVRVQRASREAVDGALYGGDGDNVAGWGIHESKRASRGDRGERGETRVGRRRGGAAGVEGRWWGKRAVGWGESRA